MTGEEVRVRAERLFLRIMDKISFGRGIDAPIEMIAEELLLVATEAREDARRQIAKGPNSEMSLVMLSAVGHEGWANLILDRERRYIAMLPPPIAEVLKEYVPLARNGGADRSRRRPDDRGSGPNVATEGDDHA